MSETREHPRLFRIELYSADELVQPRSTQRGGSA